MHNLPRPHRDSRLATGRLPPPLRQRLRHAPPLPAPSGSRWPCTPPASALSRSAGGWPNACATGASSNESGRRVINAPPGLKDESTVGVLCFYAGHLVTAACLVAVHLARFLDGGTTDRRITVGGLLGGTVGWFAVLVVASLGTPEWSHD